MLHAADEPYRHEIDRLRSGLDKPATAGSSMTTRETCFAKYQHKARLPTASAVSHAGNCLRP